MYSVTSLECRNSAKVKGLLTTRAQHDCGGSTCSELLFQTILSQYITATKKTLLSLPAQPDAFPVNNFIRLLHLFCLKFDQEEEQKVKYCRLSASSKITKS